MHYIARYLSPIGGITMASDGRAIAGLWIDGQKYYAENLLGDYEEKELPIFTLTKKWLDIYFTGSAPDFTPPLLAEGVSPFRRRVREILLTIPFGRVTTYGSIAKRIERETGGRVSAQAVGGAVGHNPISIIIPCHRVVGASGCLTGYAGGIDKKIALLKNEGADISEFTLPKNTRRGE